MASTNDEAVAARLVSILRAVPEARPRVFTLAQELIDSDGNVREDLAAARKQDIQLAIVEAESHARATAAAVKAIRELA